MFYMSGILSYNRQLVVLSYELIRLREGETNCETRLFNVPWNAQYWPSIAVLNSVLLRGTVHHPTKFQADV